MFLPYCKHLVLAASFALLANAHAQQAPAPRPAATEAVMMTNTATFLQHHARFQARAKSAPVGLLFLGDSITANWQRAPHIWEAYYGKYQPANFGIGGARTQNLIWQIENGALEGIAPRVVVLMMGTNNSLDYSAEEIAGANRKIVGMIRARLPESKILVLGMFPRGPREPKGAPLSQATMDEAAKRMATIAAVNRDLAGLDDGKAVRFLDIGGVFLGQDGRIPASIMPDQLHLSAAGYQLWADAMQPLLEGMLK